ncbi:hypothetical protein [Pseudomonas sp. MWU12-2323]|uniref:hypothetical protein n=1 Tax=Pseudomonas sp. MWU12-2323 TaxID=2651296 RepID=UPI00128CBE78|nr:hypothetical protein [Pseudomonas sp. MWU12-2323]MPQ69373.1 hypothetical protein [Pseudomonas sp. MWU12-2323]
MTKPQQPLLQRNQSLDHGKTMLSALIGAVIGCGAMFLSYGTLLGGTQIRQKVDQIELTVEHNRLVAEESLALLKKFDANVQTSEPHGDIKLSKQPTPRELNEAIDGLFKGLDEAAPAGTDTPGTKPDQTTLAEQEHASAQSVDSKVKVVGPQNVSDKTENK